MILPLPAHAPGVLTIDLATIAANWRALASHVAPAECAAVVKADAYGLGAARVIPALADAGCRTFFVATAEEALEARALAPDARILVLDGVLTGGTAALVTSAATPVLSTPDEIADWRAATKAAGRRLPAALHVDSGLNRLGLEASAIETLVREPLRLDGLDVRLVMSHLASADDPADPKNMRQLAAFRERTAKLPQALRSLAASDGLMLGQAFHFDLVRPGYAIYGGQAFRGGETPVSPAITLEARVLQVRDVAPGETVGYSGSWTAARRSRIAIVAAGYADGIPRTLSGSSYRVKFGSETASIVGRVSMDLITIDVTDVKHPVARGDLAMLLGPGLSIESMGQAAGTIGYEILTRLGRRFHRVYAPS